MHDELVSNTIFSKWSLEPMFIFDENGICIHVNDAATRIFQYQRQEFIGRSLYFLVFEQDIPLINQTISDRHTEPYQIRLVRKDGSIFYAMIQGQYTVYNGQNVRISTCRDISEIKKVQQQLEQQNKILESIFNNNVSGIVVLNKDRDVEKLNQVAANIVGYDDPNELIGMNMADLHISQSIYDEFTHLYSSSLMKREKSIREIQLAKKDGSRIWVRVSGSLISTDEPPKLEEGIAWVIDDISEIKQAEKKMLEAYNELEIIFHNALVGILVLGKDRIIQKVNQTFVDMIGFSAPEDWIGKSSREIHLNHQTYTQFAEKYYQDLITHKTVKTEYQLKDKNAQPIWVSLSGKAIDSATPANLDKGVVWVATDINQHKLMEKKLTQLAREDSLTSLYNRRYFLERSTREFKLMNRFNKNLSLLMVDIDNFKSVNDTYGHDIGDKALIFFSKICTSIVREVDIVGRIGGEEFAILLLDSNLGQANTIANRILNELKVKSTSTPDIPTITASIGAIEIGQQEELTSAMIRADKLLYKSKKEGKDKVSY
ncbi:diguanylate cyclase [Vibrio sp. TH_r3]|uniref:sensor domain-containing diguanylate cyclase n=1 Tax=Vibrio sp. TH_r3 TaxID=3082084 RepID=UPI0029555447|nr:diguanylate cyclase [Vibrio sp. TH_r3]MDV7105974.1 diguanylate cyclase [Vibrio sp. TH_r3]